MLDLLYTPSSESCFEFAFLKSTRWLCQSLYYWSFSMSQRSRAHSLITCIDEVIEVVEPFRGSCEISTQSTSSGNSTSISASAIPGGRPRDMAIVRSRVYLGRAEPDEHFFSLVLVVKEADAVQNIRLRISRVYLLSVRACRGEARRCNPIPMHLQRKHKNQ